MQKRYVYKGKEVVLTGRTASKSLRSGKEEILYETKPIDIADLSSTKYNEWVKLKDLFEIQMNEDNQDEKGDYISS